MRFIKPVARAFLRFVTGVLIALFLVVGNYGWAVSREPQWSSSLTFCDLVVQGTVSHIGLRSERLGDVSPDKNTAKPDMIIDVAEVTLDVVEVFKGRSSASSVTFVVNVSSSVYRDNYEIGQDMVVGLVWGEDVLGGTYWLFSDRARFLHEEGDWKQQRGDMVSLDDLGDIRHLMSAVAPRRVLANEEWVIVGRLVGLSFVQLQDPGGFPYIVKRLSFTDVLSIAGPVAQRQIVVDVVVSGDFWPEWREVSSFPQVLAEGRVYCVALRSVEGGFVIPFGRDGIFEVDGQELRSVSREAVGLSLDDVSAQRGDR